MNETEKIKKCFDNGGKTMREVADITGMDIFSVSYYMADLRRTDVIIASDEKRISNTSGRSNTVWKLNPDKIKDYLQVNLWNGL